MLTHDTLLLAGGSADNRRALREIFEESFNVLEAGNTPQTMFLLEQNRGCIALVLLDATVPECVDLTVLETMEGHGLKSVPVLALTPAGDTAAVCRAFEMGAIEAMDIDYDAFVLQKRVQNIVELHRHKWHLEELVEEQADILRHSNDAMVDVLSSIIEYRSLESGQHILRIRRYTQVLLREIAVSSPRHGLDERTIDIISSAAALHDIGKISIPDAILNKPAPLTDTERRVMQTHAETGSRIIETLADVVDHRYLRYAYNICRYHHERWDGSGYPEGLSGDGIPICAQVVGLADAYDALTTRRVYKDAVGCEEAAIMIIGGECGVFSPILLECFKNVIGRFAEIARAYADGASPRAERFDTRLPGPSQKEELNALHRLRSKYQMLLHYVDATVVEVDQDQGVYHVVYNPDPDLLLLSDSSSLRDLDRALEDQARLPEEKAAVRNVLESEIPRLRREGLLRLQCRLPIYGKNADKPEVYDVTILRQSLADREQNKLITIWKRLPRPDSPGTTGWDISGRIPGELKPGFLCCRNDRCLTVEKTDAHTWALFGLTEEEFTLKTAGGFPELIDPRDRDGLRRQIIAQLSEGKRLELEFRIPGTESGSRWLMYRCILETDGTGREIFSGLLLDITGLKLAQESQQRKLEHQQIILSQTENVLYEWDLKTDKLTFSESWGKIFGYPPVEGELFGRLSTDSRFHPEDVSVVMESIAAMGQGSDYQVVEVRVAKADGRYLWCRFRSSAIRGPGGALEKILGVIINIDEEKRSAQALQERAERDTLTKLLNKSAARKQTEDYLAGFSHNTNCALFIIDMDNFKQINDRFGHLFGDAVLTQAAREIRRLFRAQDIVARIGGDEFLVVMRGIADRKIAEDRCRQLVEAFGNVFRGHLRGSRLSCSVGVALFPDHGTSYSELFQRADQALYMAKDKGKNGYAVYDSTDSYYFSHREDSAAVTKIDSDDQSSLANSNIVRYAFQRLYNSADITRTIGELLTLAGNQTNVSRVYIFENSPDNRTCSNTFEWCNQGVASQLEFLQNVSYEEDVPNLMAAFDENGLFYCPDITQLPADLYDILAMQNIKSILLCAIRDNGIFRGYMGFDDCEINRYWTKEQVNMLTYLAETIFVFLLKKRLEERFETPEA